MAFSGDARTWLGVSALRETIPAGCSAKRPRDRLTHEDNGPAADSRASPVDRRADPFGQEMIIGTDEIGRDCQHTKDVSVRAFGK
jgi:hypothetical protein